jgi:hypothetical protein
VFIALILLALIAALLLALIAGLIGELALGIIETVGAMGKRKKAEKAGTLNGAPDWHATDALINEPLEFDPPSMHMRWKALAELSPQWSEQRFGRVETDIRCDIPSGTLGYRVTCSVVLHVNAPHCGAALEFTSKLMTQVFGEPECGWASGPDI